jgi:hypothetical protein
MENNLTAVENGTFKGLSLVQELNLMRNQISVIESGAFYDMKLVRMMLAYTHNCLSYHVYRQFYLQIFSGQQPYNCANRVVSTLESMYSLDKLLPTGKTSSNSQKCENTMLCWTRKWHAVPCK